MGSIFVEIKKNRPSRQRLTGCTDSAYAAGMASRSTSAVDPTVAITEWVRKGAMPEKVSRNSASVGVKTNFGGQVSADDSGLNAVTIIHSTGRKNAIATTHASTAHPARADQSRNRNLSGRGAADSAVMPVPPRT